MAVQPNDDVLDATIGAGGHAAAILEATAPRGRLLGLDLDPAALERARQRLTSFGERAVLVRAPFADLTRVAGEHAFKPSAILLDLGVSMDQLQDTARGFSFAAQGPLDMRMDPSQPLTAAVLLDTWKTESLVQLLQTVDEPLARPIANAIAKARATRSIQSTTDLADLVAAVSRRYRRSWSRVHPATRTFLALRMAVNDELGQVRAALPAALDLLSSGGRLAVLTFHSGEDRVVKMIFRAWALGCTAPEHVPGCTAEHRPRVRIPLRHPTTASRAEVTTSPASRSARLRSVVKA